MPHTAVPYPGAPSPRISQETADVVVVGAGAAGLMAAIACARSGEGRLRVVVLDGARHVGAKILVSGGGRCNVTNREVREHDYRGGHPRAIRHVLRAFPVARTIAFFAEEGVRLHEEEDGKLFPDAGRARVVLDALLDAAARAGARVRASQRVRAIARDADGLFTVRSDDVEWRAARVVLATGGRSLPKSGSDGQGYELARSLGHSCTATTPSLVPLLLDGALHEGLAGITHRAELSVRVDGRRVASDTGALLWTHVGISGPVALDISRHWLGARLTAASAVSGGGAGPRPEVSLHLQLCPGETFESVEARVLAWQAARPRAQVATVLAGEWPEAIVARWLALAGIPPDTTCARLDRAARRRLVHALTDTRLDVRDSRGYTVAEVTAGGVPLDEIATATMASTRCQGLHLAGEILDVDGRLGGFNFQWAWASGWVAGTGAANAVREAQADVQTEAVP